MSGETTAWGKGQNGDCLVTSSGEQFVGSLAPGDVLLFDSAFPARAYQVRRPQPGKPLWPVHRQQVLRARDAPAQGETHGSKTQPRRAASGASRLQRDRSALGPLPGTRTPPPWPWPTARIRERTERYAYLNLMALIVPAFVRSYGSLAGAGKLLAGGLGAMSRAFLRSMGEEAVVRNFSSQLDGRQSLTCSEFVYRCYTSFPLPMASKYPARCAAGSRPGGSGRRAVMKIGGTPSTSVQPGVH